MNKILLSSILIITAFSLIPSLAFAHPHPGQVLINGHTHDPQTEIIPLSASIGLEKTTVFFHAPKDNQLPWGFVEGNISNHVDGYPVIIQIFKNGESVHFAQTGVENDGDYEYRFRVLSTNGDETTKIFDGNYSVRIFKVVYLNQNSLI
ncbi:hypothetical protein NsoK4_07925 [Nitrosopumilus sp. K4]|uniref:hypothetical protein n=1 Tax=Nitrosopumilus sp. K4 TaxID=2795383 RepID=UPI001BAE1DB4|nr:hypothetical protein [Nitrosopumilus sp. K4]QUC64346.1 hypothetical protein NsoK4_07925 [Nitrosopumilus sp. K4]